MIRELVIRAQHGDHDAFEALAKVSVRHLYGTASLIVRDPDGANDAVQDTLIEAWRSLPTLREPDAFDAWLHRVLIRHCYRTVQGRRRRVVEVRHLDLDAATPSLEGRIDTLDQIARAFDRLTVEQRAVLVLHHRMGLATAEAADILGIPVGTMKSRLSRANAALRASLEADDREVTIMNGRPA